MKEKRKRFNALLAQAGFYDHKADILAGYGATSTTELSEQELDECIARFSAIIYERNNVAEAEIRKLRSNVLSLLQKAGIYNDNGDWSAVNSFLLNPKIAGKLLYELNLDELKRLIPKLQKVTRYIIEKQHERHELAKLN